MTEIFVEAEPGTSGDPTFHVPRVPLYSAVALAGFTFLLAIGARRYGIGSAPEPISVPVEERAIRFLPQDDGSLAVLDVNSGVEVVRLRSEGGNGFLFGAKRGIDYKRNLAHVDPETPFALTRWQNGRITLDDPATGMHIAVNSFGPTQVASFEQLFRRGEPRR